VDNQFKITLGFLHDNKACDFNRREADLMRHLGIPPEELHWDSGLTLYGWAEVGSVVDGQPSADNEDLLWAAQTVLYNHRAEVASFYPPDWLKLDAANYLYDEAVRQHVLDWYTAACAAKP